MGPVADLGHELGLSGVEFIEDDGILTLAEHVRRRAAGECRLSLRGIPPPMQRTCEALEVVR